MRILCPAKVNLFLAVGPPDRRGYHPLRTIFQAVNLCDTLEVEFSGADFQPVSIEVVGAELPKDNTLTKTLRLSREIFKEQPSHIRLTKNIPMQSGLGGGSSDAAGLLRALNHEGRVPLEELEPVAAAVGADVPFFLHGGLARGERYGDRITPLPDGPEDWYVIVKPPIGCSTPEMFAALDAKPREWRDWPEGDELYNDFERVAPCECLDLIERLQVLGARDAALSGSGSAVFGRFSTRETAEAASLQIDPSVHSIWLVKTLNQFELKSSYNLMERIAVESTTLASVGYDAISRTLELEFVGGTVYRYTDVPAEAYAGLMVADSKGGYFNSQIRDRFDFEKTL